MRYITKSAFSHFNPGSIRQKKGYKDDDRNKEVHQRCVRE